MDWIYQLLGLVFWLTTPILAFQTISPQYISINNGSYVSKYVQPPLKYDEKQVTLALNNNATSTTSIAIETMTAGMSYLYSKTNDSTAFFVNITIDSKNYPVLLDTGSPYLWLYSNQCESTSCINNKDSLLPYNSKGLTYLNSTFDLSYTEDTVASGDIVSEDMMIIGNFKTDDFQFGLAESVPDIFESYPFVGVLGLPAHNSSVTGLLNIVSFLYDNGDISQSKFTICMGQFQSDEEDNNGILFLGETNDNLKNGDLYTSDILDSANGHWEIEIGGVYINNYQVAFNNMEVNNQYSNYSRIGLLDSGTTSLVLPKDDALVLHSYFSNAITDGENYAIYCNSTLEIDLEIGGKNWTITPDDYLGPAYGSTSSLDGYCVSNIQGLDSTDDSSWILGILFMMDKYVEFDYENQCINIAERNSNIKFVNPASISSSAIASTTLITSTSSSSVSTSRLTSTISTHNSASTLKHSILTKLLIFIFSLFTL